jgi:4-alpha-glucanotransferase
MPATVSAVRSSGVLLHVTSLPSGRLDEDAYRFVDWLVAAGQSWWQVLPLHPPDAVGSPYASASAFAGWDGLLALSAPSPAAQDEAKPEITGAWLDEWVAFAGEAQRERQQLFQREWLALRRYANARGIHLIGDIPLYVDGGSVDVAAHPQLFDHDLRAGAAPSSTHPNGQVWGMPVYDWAANAAESYAWWLDRLARELELFDLVRIDHFRGLVKFWAIPAGEDDPLAGSWYPGPGRDLFEAARRRLDGLPFILENLGLITPDVDELQAQLGLPGMNVVTRGRADAGHPAEWRDDSVLYTSTHDSDTLMGWWSSTGRALFSELARGARPGQDEHAALLERALTTPNPLVIVSAQDVLGLGSEARMNTPGTVRPHNWTWQLSRALDERQAEQLRHLTERSGRLPQSKS